MTAMSSVRPALATACLVTLVALMAGGCTADSPAAKSSPSAGSSTTAAALTAAGIGAQLRHGLTDLHSAHLVVAAGALGGTSEGDFTFALGKVTGSSIVLVQQGSKVEVITVGATSYAKLPSGENTSGKPWIKVRADSRNEFVRGLSATLDLNQAVASLSDIVGLTSKGRSVQDKGTATIGGTSTRHYALTVVASSGSTNGLEQELALLGSKPIPVDLWLDSAGRPAEVAVALPIGGQTFSVTVTASKVNTPVTITAPPAGQVSDE